MQANKRGGKLENIAESWNIWLHAVDNIFSSKLEYIVASKIIGIHGCDRKTCLQLRDGKNCCLLTPMNDTVLPTKNVTVKTT